MGGRLLRLPVLDRGHEAADRVAAGVQRQREERPQRHRNRWIDAPKVEKRLIDTAPQGVDTGSPRSSSSTGTAAATSSFHVYSKTGEPDPDTGYDFGADRDTRKIVAWGGTTPDDEETGLGRRGVNRVWFYDLSAGPEAGAATSTSTTPTSTATASPTTASRSRGSTAATGRSRRCRTTSARSSATSGSTCCSPARRCTRRTSRPTGCPDRVDLDINTLEGLPGVDASREFIKRDLFLQEERELPAGFGLTADYQDLPFAGDFKRCFEGEFPPRASRSRASRSTGSRRTRTCSWRRRSTSSGSSRATATTRPGSSTSRRRRRADAARLRGRQLARRHAERRVQLRLARHRRGRLRPDDDDDPRVRAPLVDEPPARRLRPRLGRRLRADRRLLLRLARRRVELDHELHRRELGLQPVRPRQLGPSPRRRVRADRQPDRGGHPARPRPRARRRATSRRPTASCGGAQDALEAHDYNGMLAHAASAYRHVRAGAAKAGVTIKVRQPSTWTVLRRRARGSRIAPSLIDLGAPQNRKRACRGGAESTTRRCWKWPSPRRGPAARRAGSRSGARCSTPSGALLGRGHNQRVQRGDPSAHGETEAFRNAGRRRSYRDTTMVTTLAPCWYCSGLIRQFGIGTVVVGESRTFQGGDRVAARGGRRGDRPRLAGVRRPARGVHRAAPGGLGRGHRRVRKPSAAAGSALFFALAPGMVAGVMP